MDICKSDIQTIRSLLLRGAELMARHAVIPREHDLVRLQLKMARKLTEKLQRQSTDKGTSK